jgi:hypothetical protein
MRWRRSKLLREEGFVDDGRDIEEGVAHPQEDALVASARHFPPSLAVVPQSSPSYAAAAAAAAAAGERTVLGLPASWENLFFRASRGRGINSKITLLGTGERRFVLKKTAKVAKRRNQKTS